MQAIVFEDIDNVRYTNVADPQRVEPDDIVVKLELAGLCGSDIHPYKGRETGLDRGTVMGHEGIGTVVEAGDRSGFSEGDRVYIPFTTSCGICLQCRRGLTSRCRTSRLFGWRTGGRGLHGLQAEYVRVPDAAGTAVQIPTGLGDTVALLLGDVLSTGYFGVEQALAGAPQGALLVVVGLGPVGLMAVRVARERPGVTVIGIDHLPARLTLAESFGAEVARPEDAAALVASRSDGLGAEAVVEAVGSRDAQATAFDLVRPGGTLATVGVHTAGFAFDPAAAYDRNLTFRIGRCPARRLMTEILPLARTIGADLERVVSHRIPLADGPDAYQMFAEQKDDCLKVLFTM